MEMDEVDLIVQKYLGIKERMFIGIIDDQYRDIIESFSYDETEKDTILNLLHRTDNSDDVSPEDRDEEECISQCMTSVGSEVLELNNSVDKTKDRLTTGDFLMNGTEAKENNLTYSTERNISLKKIEANEERFTSSMEFETSKKEIRENGITSNIECKTLLKGMINKDKEQTSITKVDSLFLNEADGEQKQEHLILSTILNKSVRGKEVNEDNLLPIKEKDSTVSNISEKQTRKLQKACFRENSNFSNKEKPVVIDLTIKTKKIKKNKTCYTEKSQVRNFKKEKLKENSKTEENESNEKDACERKNVSKNVCAIQFDSNDNMRSKHEKKTLLEKEKKRDGKRYFTVRIENLASSNKKVKQKKVEKKYKHNSNIVSVNKSQIVQNRDFVAEISEDDDEKGFEIFIQKEKQSLKEKESKLFRKKPLSVEICSPHEEIEYEKKTKKRKRLSEESKMEKKDQIISPTKKLKLFSNKEKKHPYNTAHVHKIDNHMTSNRMGNFDLIKQGMSKLKKWKQKVRR